MDLATENGGFRVDLEWIYPLKMVIFQSFVCLPEGIIYMIWYDMVILSQNPLSHCIEDIPMEKKTHPTPIMAIQAAHPDWAEFPTTAASGTIQ